MEPLKNGRAYFIINPGSASKKYALYRDGKELCAVRFEKEAGGFTALIKTAGARTQEKTAVSREHYHASAPHAYALMRGALGGAEINTAGAGIRVVAPGAYFLSHAIINDEYLAQCENARKIAPLHVEIILAELAHVRAVFPAMPVAGISDSAFHADMPARARRYAIPEECAQKWGLYRWGYHGISAQSALARLAEMTGAIPSRIIVCHLGSGASITAIKNGKSIDTSMGFTPLEGLPMGTRIGAIDAGAVLHLLSASRMSPEELRSFFNHQCGLSGISGGISDIRELIARETDGDERARQALAYFVYHIQKYIGAYAAALGGIDVLVFTGTVGERSCIIRERICEGLAHFGIAQDAKKNNAATETDGFIERDETGVKIAVIIADELRVIAQETDTILRGLDADSIP